MKLPVIAALAALLLLPSVGSAQNPPVEARIVFVSFPGYTSTLPSWAESYRSELEQLISIQSRGQKALHATILTPPGNPNGAWVASHESAWYAAKDGDDGFGTLNTEIMNAIYGANHDAWTNVQEVFMVHYRCTFHCTDNSSESNCEQTCPVGGVSRLSLIGSVEGFYGQGITQRFYYPLVDETPNENFAKYVAAHEYGHHLVGNTHTPGTDSPPTSDPEYVNMGRYDIMRSYATDINSEGALPFHPEWLNNWVPTETIGTDTEGVRVPDIRSPGAKIIRVVPKNQPRFFEQYFECANYQGGNLFDEKYQGHGLLFTHVIPSVAWDIESAAGKFTLGSPDPVSGKDPLEADPYFHGSAADFFDGDTGPLHKDTFNPGTNPNTNIYHVEPPNNLPKYSSPQSVKTSVAFENIHRDTNGDMLMDVFVDPKQKVAFPNGGESLPRGMPYTIRWVLRPVTALITTVDVDLSNDGGNSWSTLATGLANTGSYAWTPTANGNQFRVRVRSHDQAGGTGVDDSNANFTIADPPGAPTIHVDWGYAAFQVWWTGRGDEVDSGTPLRWVVYMDDDSILGGAAQAPGIQEVVERNWVAPCTYHDIYVRVIGQGGYRISQTNTISGQVCCSQQCDTERSHAGGRGDVETRKYVLALAPPHPNPAKDGSTEITWSIPQERVGERFQLALFDVSGRKVATVAEGKAEAGSFAATLRRPGAAPLKGGAYFLRLQIGSSRITRSLILGQ